METSSVWTATIWSKEVFGTNERKDFSIHWWLSCSQPDGVYAVYPLAGTFTLLKMYSSLAAKARVLPSRSSSSHWACLVWVTSPVWVVSYCVEAEVLPCVHPKGSGAVIKKCTVVWQFWSVTWISYLATLNPDLFATFCSICFDFVFVLSFNFQYLEMWMTPE